MLEIAAITDVRSVEPPPLPAAVMAAALLAMLIMPVLIAAELVEIPALLETIPAALLLKPVVIYAWFEAMAATTEVRSVEPPPLPAAGIAAALLAMLMTLVLMPALLETIAAALLLKPVVRAIIFPLMAAELALMAKVKEVTPVIP